MVSEAVNCHCVEVEETDFLENSLEVGDFRDPDQATNSLTSDKRRKTPSKLLQRNKPRLTTRCFCGPACPPSSLSRLKTPRSDETKILVFPRFNEQSLELAPRKEAGRQVRDLAEQLAHVIGIKPSAVVLSVANDIVKDSLAIERLTRIVFSHIEGKRPGLFSLTETTNSSSASQSANGVVSSQARIVEKLIHELGDQASLDELQTLAWTLEKLSNGASQASSEYLQEALQGSHSLAA